LTDKAPSDLSEYHRDITKPMTPEEALGRDVRLYRDSRRPGTHSIWAALMMDRGDLLAREDDMNVPGIVGLGEVLVRRMWKGDVAATNIILERIQGKIGLQKGDVDPDAEQRAGERQDLIEDLVRAFTAAKRGDVIDIKAEEVEHPAEPSIEQETPSPAHAPTDERGVDTSDALIDHTKPGGALRNGNGTGH